MGTESRRPLGAHGQKGLRNCIDNLRKHLGAEAQESMDSFPVLILGPPPQSEKLAGLGLACPKLPEALKGELTLLMSDE